MLLRLLPGETVVGAAAVAAAGGVLLASRQGQIKRLAVESLRLCQRGDLGQIGMRFLDRADALVDLRADTMPLVAVRLQGSTRSLRLMVAELEQEDPTTPGRGLGLASGQEVAELVPLIRP